MLILQGISGTGKTLYEAHYYEDMKVVILDEMNITNAYTNIKGSKLTYTKTDRL
jgi:hypothetical protein